MCNLCFLLAIVVLLCCAMLNNLTPQFCTTMVERQLSSDVKTAVAYQLPQEFTWTLHHLPPYPTLPLTKHLLYVVRPATQK